MKEKPGVRNNKSTRTFNKLSIKLRTNTKEPAQTKDERITTKRPALNITKG